MSVISYTAFCTILGPYPIDLIIGTAGAAAPLFFTVTLYECDFPYICVSCVSLALIITEDDEILLLFIQSMLVMHSH